MKKKYPFYLTRELYKTSLHLTLKNGVLAYNTAIQMDIKTWVVSRQNNQNHFSYEKKSGSQGKNI